MTQPNCECVMRGMAGGKAHPLCPVHGHLHDGPERFGAPADPEADERLRADLAAVTEAMRVARVDDSLVPDLTEDGLPYFVPVERLDALVRCQRCGAVVEGDVVGQQQHHVWHRSLDSRVRRAWMPPRYA